MQITKTTRRDITTPWRWRTGNGRMLLPEDMTCNHLANTLIMIWNHAVPEYMRTHEFVHYSFDHPMYTKAYMRIAVMQLFKELDKRRPWFHMDEVQRKRLDIIRSWLNTADFDEVFSVTHIPVLEHKSERGRQEETR